MLQLCTQRDNRIIGLIGRKFAQITIKTEMKPIRILLAEDHGLVRAGIRSLLQGLSGILVVGEAADGLQAVELISSLRPDVVLMDISMPGLNGLEASIRISRSHPQVRIIILSMHAGKEYVLAAMRAGASGYLLKDAGTEELEMAVKSVGRGEIFLSPGVSRHLVDDYLTRSQLSEAPLDRLTSRQREILQLIAEGLTTKDIARRLDLSIKTIETHRTQLMDRLDIHELAGLVRYAVRSGIVSDE